MKVISVFVRNHNTSFSSWLLKGAWFPHLLLFIIVVEGMLHFLAKQSIYFVYHKVEKHSYLHFYTTKILSTLSQYESLYQMNPHELVFIIAHGGQLKFRRTSNENAFYIIMSLLTSHHLK